MKRLANALRTFLPEFESLDLELSQAQPLNIDSVLQIIDMCIALRGRIHNFEPEAFAFVYNQKLGHSLSEKDIQLLTVNKTFQDTFFENYSRDIYFLNEIRKELVDMWNDEAVKKRYINFLRARLRDWHDRLELDWIPTLDPSSLEKGIKETEIIPELVLKSLPKEVRINILKAQSAIRCSRILEEEGKVPIYEGCAMYLRKTLETAIVIRFKQEGKDTTLYEDNGNMFQLLRLLGLANNEKYITANHYNQLKKVKWFGDTGVHDFKVELHETDVEPVFQLMRLVLEHLFSK